MSTQALAKNEAKRDILALVQSDKVKQQLALVLPKHITSDRMARVACTAIMRTPKLLQCTQESLLDCLMRCSQFGLEPDGRRAHLIPFENRKTGTVECTLILDWKGIAELAMRGGSIAKLHADLICDKDEFAYDLGEILHHKINFREPRGEPYAAYAMAVTKTGEKFVQVMTKGEIEAIRDNSQGWRAFKAGYTKQSPWQDAPGEMWKKTTFRRLSKWLPLSPEEKDAIENDDDDVRVPIKAKVTAEDLMLPALPEFGSPSTEEPAPIEVAGETAAPEPAPKKPAKKTDPVVSQEQPPAAAPNSLEALEAAMQKAEVVSAQVLGFYNGGNLRQKDAPEATQLSDLPAPVRTGITKALNDGNAKILAALRAIEPV